MKVTFSDIVIKFDSFGNFQEAILHNPSFIFLEVLLLSKQVIDDLKIDYK